MTGCPLTEEGCAEIARLPNLRSLSADLLPTGVKRDASGNVDLPALRNRTSPAVAQGMSDEAVAAFWQRLKTDNPGLPVLSGKSLTPRNEPRIQWASQDRWLRLTGLKELQQINALKDTPFTHLNLVGTAVSDVSVLQSMPLRTLFIQPSATFDLGQLRKLKLWEILVEGSAVKDLTDIVNPELQLICLYRTQVSDLSPLAICGKLRDLQASDTLITDLSPVAALPLATLEIARTPVTSLEPLRGKALRSLDIRGCAIQDLSPMLGNAALQTLHCDAGTFNAATLAQHLR